MVGIEEGEERNSKAAKYDGGNTRKRYDLHSIVFKKEK